jgi:hypothetical protein
MQTALHLLTREGAIHVVFSIRLTAEQYAGLVELVGIPTTATKAELRKAIEQTANRWGTVVEIDD